MKTIHGIIIALIVGYVSFIVVDRKATATCYAQKTVAPLPYVAIGGYSGYLDVSGCTNCIESYTCYLADVTQLQYCKDAPETPFGCEPITVNTSARQGRCNVNRPAWPYKCGCGNFSPNTTIMPLNSARTCTP